MTKKTRTPNVLLTDCLNGMGLNVNVKKQTGESDLLEITGNLASVIRFMDASKKSAKSQGIALPINHVHNRDEIDRIQNENPQDIWWGGSIESLRKNLDGKIDLSRHYAEKVRLANSALMQRLSTKLADIAPKRKRRNSEHDGEWSFDRRFEIEPFASTTRHMTPARTIDIVCYFAANGSASAESLDRYGAMVWALADIIETAGINSRVLFRSHSLDCNSSHGNRKSVDALIEIELKKAGTYVAPSLLAAVFQTKFFRRVALSLRATALDCFDEKITYGFGRSTNSGVPIEFKDGALVITPDVMRGYTDMIESEVLKAIDCKVA